MKPIILIALVFVMLAVNACANQTNSCQLPAIDVTWWATVPDQGEIVDVQHNKHLKTTDPAFGEYACIPLDDVFQLYALIQQCRSCQTGYTPTQSQHQSQQ